MSTDLSANTVPPAWYLQEATSATRVLLVEDSPDYARLVQHTLSTSATGNFEVTHTTQLKTALRELEESDFDAILLDLTLPDGRGAFTIDCACSLANHIPVLVLTGTGSEALAMEAVKAGAQEYLVKDEFDHRRLPGIVLRAVARHGRRGRLIDLRARQRDRDLAGSRLRGEADALSDSLTGLCSELVFCDRLTHALDQAERRPHPIVVMILRIPGLDDLPLRAARDELVHRAADRLACHVRKSDTLARIRDDTFAILLDGSSSIEGVERTAACLLQSLERMQMHHSSGIAVLGVPASLGIAVYPTDGRDLETLMENAEEAERRCERDSGRQPRFYSDVS